jgi:hypothetical protein
MRTTMSQDGERRTNFRIEYRLDKAQVTNLLAMYSNIYGDVGEELSEKTLLEMVKKQLMYQGMDALDFGTNEGIDEDTFDWAKEQVEKFWKTA